MSLTILTLAQELAITKCMLTYDRDPLVMLGMRQHFIDYQLNPNAPDAFFLGEMDGSKVKRMFTVTIRGNETVLKNPLGDVNVENFIEAVVFCKKNALSNGYSKVINTILSVEQDAALVNETALEDFIVTKLEIKAGSRMKDKIKWLNVMNRNVFSFDTVFTTMEF